MRKKEKGSLLLALTRLIQVITLILFIYVIQKALAVIAGIALLLFRLSQPVGLI